MNAWPASDREALSVWHFPSNHAHADYLLKFIESCIRNNSLIVSPSRSELCLIASITMFNFGRWFPDGGKMVFISADQSVLDDQMADLVQNMECNGDDIVKITGNIIPSIRERLWNSKRHIFLSPQVFHNDLVNGCCPQGKIALLIVDDPIELDKRGALSQTFTLLSQSRPGSMFRTVALTSLLPRSIDDLTTIMNRLNLLTIRYQPGYLSPGGSTPFEIQHVEISEQDFHFAKSNMHKNFKFQSVLNILKLTMDENSDCLCVIFISSNELAEELARFLNQRSPNIRSIACASRTPHFNSVSKAIEQGPSATRKNVLIVEVSQLGAESFVNCHLAIAFDVYSIPGIFYRLETAFMIKILLSYPGEEQEKAELLLRSHSSLIDYLGKKTNTTPPTELSPFSATIECLKRPFNSAIKVGTSKNKESKIHSFGVFAGFERVTKNALDQLRPLRPLFKHRSTCLFGGNSKRIKDFGRIISIELDLSTKDDDNLTCNFDNWRAGLDAVSLQKFLDASKGRFNKRDEVPVMEISDIPESFFDEIECNKSNPGVPIDLTSIISVPSYPATQSASNTIAFQPRVLPAHFARIITSPVHSSSMNSPEANLMARKFVESQAVCNTSEDEDDSESGYSQLSSFICDDETSVIASTQNMMGFYRQSLLQSPPKNDFRTRVSFFKPAYADPNLNELSEMEDLNWDGLSES